MVTALYLNCNDFLSTYMQTVQHCLRKTIKQNKLFIEKESLKYLVKVDSPTNSGFVFECCAACQPCYILCTKRTEKDMLEDRATSLMIYLKENSNTSLHTTL